MTEENLSKENIKPSSKMVQLIDEFLDSYADVTLRAERLVLQADEEGIPRKLIASMLRGVMKRRGITRDKIDYRMKVIGLYTRRFAETHAQYSADLPVESSIPLPAFGKVIDIPTPPAQTTDEILVAGLEGRIAELEYRLENYVGTFDPNKFDRPTRVKLIGLTPTKIYFNNRYEATRVE